MSDVEEKINKIIVESILPSVQMHGGHVELQSFKDGIVTVFLSGACSGCAMSTQTLKMGIENMLKYYIPEVLAVEGIEDPNSTVSPYYQWHLKPWHFLKISAITCKIGNYFWHLHVKEIRKNQTRRLI